MTKQRPQFTDNELYHISSRAVGDAVIFESEADFYRGMYSIYEFNNNKPILIREKRRLRDQFKKKMAKMEWVDEREKFVEIYAFSFMPNHFHLILKQLRENGIVKFMKKVNGGYAKFFNEKYNRKGHLFNKFNAVHIEDDNQLRTVFNYVHTNLISIIEPGWKEKGIKNPRKVKEFLENNKRHSYLDYIGKKNFPYVTERDFLLKLMGGAEGCKTSVDNWIMQNKITDVGRL